MKHIMQAALLAACATLGACAEMKNLAPTEFDSGGAVDVPLRTLALTANPVFSPNDLHPPSDPSGSELPEVSHFTETFARGFPDALAERLRRHGVSVLGPGRGIPLLRVYVSTYRLQCQQRSNCQTEVHVEGSLLEAAGTRTWWFSDWLALDDMDAQGTAAFYDMLASAMARSGVIPP